MRRRAAMLVPLLAAGGCGGSHHHPSNTTAPAPTASGTKTFTAPGMALRFSYPVGFKRVRLSPERRASGNLRKASASAIGIGRYDLLVVTRFPKRPIAVTQANVAKLKHEFDKAISAAFNRRMSSAVRSIAGLPALSYPPANVIGLPVRATSRVTLVFIGDNEYELNCQYTASRASRVGAACDQMLATLRASR